MLPWAWTSNNFLRSYFHLFWVCSGIVGPYSSFFFFKFFYLRRHLGKESWRKENFHIVWLTWLLVGPSWSSEPGIRFDLPVWQGPMCLSYHLLPPARVWTCKKLELGAKPGALIRHAVIFTSRPNHPVWLFCFNFLLIICFYDMVL